MPVNGRGMLHRHVEHLFFRAGDFERAILFVRVIPAIDEFSVRYKNWGVKTFYRDEKAVSRRRTPKRLRREIIRVDSCLALL
jgi:hypothetical protein